jgi:hypothetical protein
MYQRQRKRKELSPLESYPKLFSGSRASVGSDHLPYTARHAVALPNHCSDALNKSRSVDKLRAQGTGPHRQGGPWSGCTGHSDRRQFDSLSVNSISPHQLTFPLISPKRRNGSLNSCFDRPEWIGYALS